LEGSADAQAAIKLSSNPWKRIAHQSWFTFSAFTSGTTISIHHGQKRRKSTVNGPAFISTRVDY